MRNIAAFILFIMAVSATFSLQSCYKVPKEGSARIIVIDENQLRVPFATVRLFRADVSFAGTTDHNGIVLFENLLEVILTVEAKRANKVGTGVARIKPDQTITEVVTIY